MPISDKFQKRLKILRTTYQLSHQEITDCLNMKSRTNISNWELGKNIPSLDILCDITSLFAIRTDWILGYVDYPYDNEIMLSLEYELLNCTNEYPNIVQYNPIRNLQWIPEEYKNTQLRINTYSLDVRANLIYLLRNYNAFRNAAIISSLENNRNSFKEKLIVYQRYYQILLEPEKYQKKLKLQNQQIVQLRTLLAAKDFSIPLYDLIQNISDSNI